MNSIIELLKANEGKLLINQDGLEDHLKLLPGLTEDQLMKLERSLPCPIPQDIRELLLLTNGFNVGGGLDEISFSDPFWAFGMEETFPHAMPLCADGFGNYWIVDLTSESHSWAPIFYVCHDPAVVVFQTDSLLHFVEEAIRFGNEPWRSELDDVHEKFSNRIWRENPKVLEHAQCLADGDPDLRTFAQPLDETWQFIDLRGPNLGDGFSWGRYGPKTINKRYGEKRIFAYQKKSVGRRFLDALR